MPNELRLPWTVKSPTDPMSDYYTLVDSEGGEIAVSYAMHGNHKAAQIKHILEMCNPKPEEIKEAVDVAASPSLWWVLAERQSLFYFLVIAVHVCLPSADSNDAEDAKCRLKKPLRDRVPPLVLDSLDRYVEHHIAPGSFLLAVLENNLSESFGCADMQNRYALFDIVSYIYNELPMMCWGNEEKVREWLTLK